MSKYTGNEPRITQELLDYLDHYFPDKMPEVSKLSPVEIGEASGKVHVVRFLRKLFDKQSQTVLVKSNVSSQST